jgi:8-amino-7-oxononanoate synthase
MRDVPTNGADNATTHEQAPSGLVPALKRLIIRGGLNVRASVGGAAQALADACAARRVQTVEHYDREGSPSSDSFTDLPAHRGIVKHRELGHLFSIADPFYRCHDARAGAETVIDGRRFMNFASYDYLGLNQHPAVADAAKAAIDRFGTSVSASRIVAGERPLHRELETALADFYGVESAVTFVSGHATNVSTIGTLMTPDDLVVYDELSHNSVLVGTKLSRATAMAFRHNNLEALEQVLREHRHLHKRALIVVEGLYSMDGDVADLPRLVKLKEKYGAWLMVDEAHSLGVLGTKGRGCAEHFGVDPNRVDIWMGTLSKTLAACGGYIAGKQELIDILRYQAPGLVYSVGLSPPLAAAALAALTVLKAEPERVARVQSNGQLFLSLAKAAGFDTATSEGHSIVSVIVGDLINAGRLAERLLVRGLNVLPIIYPAVPLKASRFRFFITSEHTPAQIRMAVRTIRGELDALSVRGRKAA